MDVESAEVLAEHFGVPGHKYIYMAIMYLYSKQLKPTPMSVIEVLSGAQSKKAVEDLGGLEYLLLIEESNIPEDNLQIFIEKIKQSYTRRMLLDIASNLTNFVTSDQANVLNPTELISYVEEKLNDLSVTNTISDEVYKMGDKTEEVLKHRGRNPAQVPGLEVGWPQYDRITNGAQPGDLIVLVAPSKVGKSVTDRKSVV